MRTENLSVKTTPQHFAEIQHQPVTLLVRIGEENFEGEALRAQLAFIAEHTPMCTLLLADTLQIYDKHVSPQVAKEIGAAWMTRHARLLQQTFSQGYSLMSWNTWRNHPDFETHQLALSQKLLLDKNYQEAMHCSIDTYCQQQKKTTNAFRHSCWEYLLEECAVLRFMAVKSPVLILFPNAPQPVMTQTIENTALRWIPLHFHRT